MLSCYFVSNPRLVTIVYCAQYSFCIMKASVSAQQFFFFVKNAHIWISPASLILRYYPSEKLDSYQVIAYGKSEGEGEEYTCQLIDAERRGYRR